MHVLDLLKPDGRRLRLYGREPITDVAAAPCPAGPPVRANPHLRWHPLRGEWVAYASHRQDRTFLPPPEYNPLAPTVDPAFPTELPAGRYDVAVFDNRFPTLVPPAAGIPGVPPALPGAADTVAIAAAEAADSANAPAAPSVPDTDVVEVRPAVGACEVVVFTQDPRASLGALDLDHIELVLRVWADRTLVLGGRPEIAYVLPFENRGAEVGVTLHHPHGQIYAYPVVPPGPARMLRQERAYFEGPGKGRRGLLEDLLALEVADGRRLLYRGPLAVALVPACARYPYEVWVAPLRRVGSFGELEPAERRDLARALKTVLLRYDGLFDRPFPYLMAWYQAPTDGAGHPYTHLHAEFYPPYRSRDRLKYLAGTEIAGGMFANDALPEEKAAELRAVTVTAAEPVSPPGDAEAAGADAPSALEVGAAGFTSVFGEPPRAVADAPGRVNLLGEHTDYNEGLVLPAAIPQRTAVAVGLAPAGPGRRHGHHVFHSANLAGDAARAEVPASPPGGAAPTAATDAPEPCRVPAGSFASYLYGCIRLLEAETGIAVPPLRVHVCSTVPIGAGLSSSAALEVAMLRALRLLLGLPLDDVRLARLAREAEVSFAGVRCGIMDQMASSLARPGHLLFLDTRTLEHRRVALPAGTEVVVLDSGLPRTLAASGYNQRRAECEEAARLLGVGTLRDLDLRPDAGGAATVLPSPIPLPDPLGRRVRHVLSENRRVAEAAAGVTAARFGELMNASHASLRDDFGVSTPELDTLVAILQETPGVFGARLTGAGFGGACVALVEAGAAARVAEAAVRRFAAATGRTATVLLPATAPPA